MGGRGLAAIFGALLVLAVPSAAAADDAFFASIGFVDLRTPSPDGLDYFGSGLVARFGVLEKRSFEPGRLTHGLEMGLMMLTGPGDHSLFVLQAAYVGTILLTDYVVNPFVALGGDVGQVTFVETETRVEAGTVLGMHASVGLHGFIDESFYWRGGAGFVAAGAAGFEWEILIGYAFE